MNPSFPVICRNIKMVIVAASMLAWSLDIHPDFRGIKWCWLILSKVLLKICSNMDRNMLRLGTPIYLCLFWHFPTFFMDINGFQDLDFLATCNTTCLNIQEYNVPSWLSKKTIQGGAIWKLSTIQGEYPTMKTFHGVHLLHGNYPQSTIQGNYPRRCHMKTFCPGRWMAASQWARPVSIREWAPSCSSHSSRSASRLFRIFIE